MLLLLSALLGRLILVRRVVELFDDAVAILFVFPGEDGLVFVVEVDEMLPHVVPEVLLLQVFLGVLIIHSLHLVIQGL